MNATVEAVTSAYVEAVRSELADLPGDEVAEIIEDVRDHLDLVAAELGDGLSADALADRLGTPAQYAAELRAAAGYPGSRPTGRPGGRPVRLLRFLLTWAARGGAAITAIAGLALLDAGGEWAPVFLLGIAIVATSIGLWILVRNGSRRPAEALRELPDAVRLERLYVRLGGRPWARAAMEFGRSLRPAWWVVRAWVATQLVVYLLGGEPGFPLPGSPFAVALMAGIAVASVWWGRRADARDVPQRLRSAQTAVNVVLAVAAPIMMAIASSVPSYVHTVYEPEYAGFYHQDSTPITNLYLYGPDGRILEDVRIYDQDGRPVDNLGIGWDECEGEVASGGAGHVFPRPEWYWDDAQGRCVARTEGPFGSVLPGTQVDER